MASVPRSPRLAAADLIRPLGRPGDLGWVIKAHGEMYAEEFGWDASFEALVCRIAADYTVHAERAAGNGGRAGGTERGEKAGQPRQAAWIAERDGQRVGCVFCVAADDPGAAALRLVLVDPRARGGGLGGRLVDTVIAFARSAGYGRIVLWTNDPLAAARHLYLQRGFRLVDRASHHSFGVDLVGEHYELAL